MSESILNSTINLYSAIQAGKQDRRQIITRKPS